MARTVLLGAMLVVPAGAWGQLENGTLTVLPRGGAADNVTYFVDQSGVPTLTNKVESYRSNPAYEEITIKFQPIVVPGRYKFGSGSVHYSKSDIEYLVERYSALYRLDPNLIFAVIRAESNFNPNAVSSAGACGLMQLMPGTAAEMNVSDIFDPAQNIAGGTQYLARLLDLFKGDVDLALAGYNAGPTRVKEYGGVPPFKETQRYVKNVQRFATEYASGSGAIAYHASTKRPARVTLAKSRYNVVLQSGISQAADSVSETDSHYIVGIGNRKDSIRKELVVRVETNS
jgi:soluble lytic murein transglycosylase